MTNSWQNQRVLIIGAARQGLALARYLSVKGARVTLNDKRAAEKMEAARSTLQDLPVQWALGSHPLELLDQTDLICLSGGIPLTLPIVEEAQRRGMLITNDSQIFMQSVPCRVIAITGSAGKTTTTTLVGRMAEAFIQPPARVWVGGNIGLPLVEFLDEMKPQDLVVLELSSFQLEQMTRSPHVGAILNITPNHLDRHGTLEAYTAAKARLLAFQSKEDIAILGKEDPGSWNLASQVRGKLVTFGWNRPTEGLSGAYLVQKTLSIFDGQNTHPVIDCDQIRLRGDHNILNALAACAIAHAAGFSTESMIQGITDFTGVAHRLEFVRRRNGVDWYNDSIATAPERTMAALQSFSEPLVLMLGGRDKNLPWEKLADMIHQRVDHVIVFGEAAEKIMAAIGPLTQGERPYSIDRCVGLEAAIYAASAVAENGDVVLLSPGGTSYDEFIDFEERGERFRQWVRQLT